jgi:hypothetical protein
MRRALVSIQLMSVSTSSSVHCCTAARAEGDPRPAGPASRWPPGEHPGTGEPGRHEQRVLRRTAGVLQALMRLGAKAFPKAVTNSPTVREQDGKQAQPIHQLPGLALS